MSISTSMKYDTDAMIDFSSLVGARAYKRTESSSQRESLKQQLLRKYQETANRQKSPELAEQINNEVTYYFNFDKINEAGIHVLKKRIELLSKNPAYRSSLNRKPSAQSPPSRKQIIQDIIQQKLQSQQQQQQQTTINNNNSISNPSNNIGHPPRNHARSISPKSADPQINRPRASKYQAFLPNLKIETNNEMGNYQNGNVSATAAAAAVDATYDVIAAMPDIFSQRSTSSARSTQSKRIDRSLNGGKRLLGGATMAATMGGYANNNNNTQHPPQSAISLSELSSTSTTTSRKARSVYFLEGKDEDEWVQLIHFDNRMLLKEQEAAKQKQIALKLQLKADLDKQLKEKEQRAQKEKEEDMEFAKFQEERIREQYDQEYLKEQQRIEKKQAEKLMLETQKKHEKREKRRELKRNNSNDAEMVIRIQEEQNQQELIEQEKKKAERKRQLIIQEENRKLKIQAEQEIAEDKKEDIKLTQLYGELLDQQEASREKEKQERVNKILNIQKRFSNVKPIDVSELTKKEDAAILDYQNTLNERQDQQDLQRFLRLHKQNLETKSFLDKQVLERGAREKEELELDKKQAKVWQKDEEEYETLESKKLAYIKSVNKKHQGNLLEQIRTKVDIPNNNNKMSINELKYNKDAIQKIITLAPDQAVYTHAKETSLHRPICY